MRKRLLAALLCVIMMMALLPAAVFAAAGDCFSITIDGLDYYFQVLTESSVEALGTVMLTNSPSTVTSVSLETVSNAGISYVVTRVGAAAFSGRSYLTTVSLPEVTSIDESAFESCISLATLELPKVKYIGSEAFSTCGSLTTLSLPELIEFTGSMGGAFANCRALTTVSMPKVKVISLCTFQSCSALSTLDLPEVTEVSIEAFKGCSRLAAVNTVNLPKLATVGQGAFEDCVRLTTVDLPAITRVGNAAFRGCNSLATVNLPEATEIDTNAFWGDASITTLLLPKASTIGREAFLGCNGLGSLYLPQATIIGESAFYSCHGLETVSLPEVLTIAGLAFNNCSRLTAVSMPKVTDIGDEAFRYCGALDSVTIWGNAPAVGVNPFAGVKITCKLYAPSGATGYEGSSWPSGWTPGNQRIDLWSVSGKALNPAGNGVAGATVSVDGGSTHTNVNGEYTVCVEANYSGEITAAKAGVGDGAITVPGISSALADKDILISPDLTVTAAGSSNFTAAAASGNVVFTVGAGIEGFSATNYFDNATLDGELLDLGTIGNPGVDGSVADGSIKITINPSKLNSLSAGTHSLLVTLKGLFAGKTITSTITVSAPSGGTTGGGATGGGATGGVRTNPSTGV